MEGCNCFQQHLYFSTGKVPNPSFHYVLQLKRGLTLLATAYTQPIVCRISADSTVCKIWQFLTLHVIDEIFREIFMLFEATAARVEIHYICRAPSVNIKFTLRFRSMIVVRSTPYKNREANSLNRV